MHIYIYIYKKLKKSQHSCSFFLLKGLLVFYEWRRNHGHGREGATTLYKKYHHSDVSFFLSGLNCENSAISIIIIATSERWELFHK